MGRHSKNNDNNQPKRIRDDELTKKVLDFDAEAARLDAEHAKERETWGPVQKATHDAELNRNSWGLRGRRK